MRERERDCDVVMKRIYDNNDVARVWWTPQ